MVTCVNLSASMASTQVTIVSRGTNEWKTSLHFENYFLMSGRSSFLMFSSVFHCSSVIPANFVSSSFRINAGDLGEADTTRYTTNIVYFSHRSNFKGRQLLKKLTCVYGLN